MKSRIHSQEVEVGVEGVVGLVVEGAGRLLRILGE